MMTDDAQLSALFGDDAPIADDGFTNRVLALSALEDRLAASRRASLRRVGLEAVALGAILSSFAFLARTAPAGEVVPLASPAMIGLILLGTWLAVGIRGAVRSG